ncbi:cupin domain-containing protein [Bradyrhizobium sp. ISRA443]|uniref:cupin domain-containing protein n=1 Tax=unclassified Bradyrhizobium TaxID=2631580 RepID=UPI0024794F66|nr:MULTISPECIES: cupin domain-containing protein [unclassified Bradyrhizobium]WGR90968.1 cupin domain-containing protein [Bradyrhizobium sp. ISRA435]WGS01110.1 cupin domain-containing protein [Bradyrhizobium sp. ISRA436]WGS07997.1 cupin domain-containing protein [Bradyrhizobium sp. ISRA437]WGS14885.1 cupin domain-containing protein [Bradyrhizobium sp. ISRA443]
MRINDDLTVPVIVHAAQLPWTSSPAAGVDRRMLFRVGDEVARATSIVRYAPRSAFPRHTHGGGEEIVVLDGVFEDEHGDYPVGSYFRNPPGTSHVPASKGGCTIFVRLWQFRDGDRDQIVRRPAEGRQLEPRPGAATAIELFDDGFENVRFESWMPGRMIMVENPRGLEMLVLAGSLSIGGQALTSQSWARLPAGQALSTVAGAKGAKVWLKDAPLLHPDVCRLP